MEKKSLIKVISIASAVAICVISSAAVMLTSYNDYQKYYDDVIAEKEYQEYLNSLGLEFVNISAKLKDDVGYFTDGKANPVKEDFEVRAHFTEKGREFDKKLDPKDYSIKAEEGFSEKGGNVTITYEYQPPKEEGSEVEPEKIVKTCDVYLALTKVALQELTIKTMPNRVYYSDDMEFDPTGMVVEAKYNNGHKALLEDYELEIKTLGKLASGTTEAIVGYTSDGIQVSTSVPITVVEKANYNEGAVLAIEAEEGSTVVHGHKVSETKTRVYAKYESGNVLYLPPHLYTVSSNVDVASFNSNCIVTISLKSDASITCKAVVEVVTADEVENMTSNGGRKKSVTEYVVENGEVVEGETIDVMEGFLNGDTLTYEIESEKLVKGRLYLRASALNKEQVNLNNVLKVKVNGDLIPVDMNSVVSNESNYIYNDYFLLEPIFTTGTNTIEVSFKNPNDLNLSIDKLSFRTKYEGDFYESIGDYIAGKNKDGELAELSLSRLNDFNTISGGTYIHGLCTDGTYLYASRTSYSSEARKLKVVKYDMQTGAQIAESPLTDAFIYEGNAGITYKDNKIIAFYNDGREVAISSSLKGVWEEYTEFNFEGLETATLSDVCFNAKNNQYVVRAGSSIYIFNTDKKLVKTFPITKDSTAKNINRISTLDDYIYVSHFMDSVYTPIVHMYDFDGELVSKTVVSNNLNVTAPMITASKSTNVQGLLVTNDAMYFGFLKFSTDNGGDSACILKVTYPMMMDELSIDLTVGEYASICNKHSVEGAYTMKGYDGALGKVNATNGWAMSGVSDGKYVYYSSSSGGNTQSVIYKADIQTRKVIATSAVVTDPGATSDSARLFIKDKTLYMVGFEGANIYSIELDKFVNNCTLELNTNMAFDGIGAKGITWNDNANRFALVTSSKEMYIARNNRTIEKSGIMLNAPSGYKVGSVASDDKYIYVNYTKNGQPVVPIDIFTWDGTLVKRIEVTGINFGQSTQYNAQSLFVCDGQLRVIICNWESGSKVNEWVVQIDTTIL